MKNFNGFITLSILLSFLSCSSNSQRDPSSSTGAYVELPQQKDWSPAMSLEYGPVGNEVEEFSQIDFDYKNITSQYSVKEQMENDEIRKQIDLYLNGQTFYGNSAELLINGGNSFAKKYRLLNQAKDYILFQGLVLMDDRTGLKMLPIIYRKLEEGVVIRILLDSTASWIKSHKMLNDLNDYIRSRYEALSSKYPQFERELKETKRSIWVYKAPKGKQQNYVIQHDEDNKTLNKQMVDFTAIKKSSLLSMKTVLTVMHNKLIVVDDKAILGGMNHADNYSHGGLGVPNKDGILVEDASQFEISSEEKEIINKMIPRFKKILSKQWGENYDKNYFDSKYGWRDTDMYVEGPVVKRLTDSFLRFWTYTNQKQKDSVRKMRGIFSLKKAPSTPSVPKVLPRQYMGENTTKSSDDVMMRSIDQIPSLGEIYHTRQTRWLFESAKKRIRCQAPYFTLPDELKKWIRNSLENGVQVDIFTNSITSNDVGKPMTWKARRQYARLLKDFPENFRIYEWKTATLHSKACVVDGYATVIGSSNNDHTSSYLSSEIAVTVFDEDTANTMNLAMDVDITNSDRITWEQAEKWLKKNNKPNEAKLPGRVDEWFIDSTVYKPTDKFIKKMLKKKIFTH